jgi:TonB family protein
MSYESRLNNFQSKITNPTYIALFISLILHFLVYKYGLPNFSLQDKNPPGRINVPVIELTPEEEARLPNLDLELDIPEFNNTPLDNGVQSFALPPSIGANGIPDLAPIPLPPPPNFDLPPLPPLPPLPSTDIKLPPIGDFSSLPLPPPLPPLETDSQVKPAIKPPAAIQAPLEKPPSAQKPEEVKPLQRQSQPKPPEKPATQPTPNQIAAQRQQRLNRDVRDLSGSLQKQENANTDEDARKNYVAWLNQIKTVNPEVMVIEGTYPRDACIRRLEGTSVYGLVVDTSGQVLALELIKGSEYPIFNEQASQDLSDRKFKNQTNQPKPYQVTVNYQYDAEICPSLTLPSLRKEQETKQETPSPNQKPQNTNQPSQPTNQTPEKPPANPPQPQPTNQTPEKPPANPPQPQSTNQTPENKPPANSPQPLAQ